jgi:hypothetical protein
MTKDAFDELLTSIEQGGKILGGKKPPGGIFQTAGSEMPSLTLSAAGTDMRSANV